MKDHKLLALYHRLNGVEKRALHKFLASPFFNQKQEVSALWAYLNEDYAQNPEGFSTEVAFQKMYPGQVYDAALLRYAMSWLLQNIEHFLAYRQMQGNKLDSMLALATVYRNKNLGKHFDHIMRQATQELAQKNAQDANYYRDKYRLEFEQYSFVESQVRSASNNLAEVGRALDVHLLALKLRQSCLQLAHQAVYNAHYDYSFLPALLQYLENSEYLQLPAIRPYYYCYRALTENNEYFFRQFTAEINTPAALHDQRESRTLYLLAINFCIRQINEARELYVQQAFDLYQRGIESRILLENGKLSRFAYKNAVALGLSLREFDWADTFIETYKDLLEPRYRDAYYCYNKARLFFTQKNYRQAMPLLVQVDDSDLLLNLDAKVMLLKMYYETAEFDALDSLLSSFRTLVNRQRMIGYHKAFYIGIIRYTQKLLHLNPNDKKAIEKLRQEVEKADRLPEKKWVLEMLGSR